MSSEDLKQRNEGNGYILVDLDRTLANYRSWSLDGTGIGAPVPAMVERVRRWLHMGCDVRIFTARASRHDPGELALIQTWCSVHIGEVLPIQNWKDFHCIAIWDDLAISVEANTGWRSTVDLEEKDPLDPAEEDRLVTIALETL